MKGNTLAETTMVTDCHDKKLDILVKFFLLNNHLSKSRKLSFACFAKWYSITFYFAICTTWYVVVTTMTQISSALQSLILNVATVLIVIVSSVTYPQVYVRNGRDTKIPVMINFGTE